MIELQNIEKYYSKNWGSVASSSECYVLLKPDVSSEEMAATMLGFNKNIIQKRMIMGINLIASNH